MGGKKKLGLKQMERMQSKEDEEKAKDKKKEKAGTPKEKRTTIIGVVAPDVKNEKIVGEIKKMNVLTPYAVATRFGIRISAAKDFLEQLEANGAVELVSGSHNIKIYKPVAA
jgi:small subunit ribosomal protein S25e